MVNGFIVELRIYFSSLATVKVHTRLRYVEVGTPSKGAGERYQGWDNECVLRAISQKAE